MARCPVCNSKVDRLYNGKCTGCMSLNVLKENSDLEDVLNELSPELMRTSGELNKPGGFAKAFKRSDNEKKIMQTLSENRGRTSLTSKAERVYNMAVRKANLTDKEKVAYMPSLKQLFKRYEPMFICGEYRFCKKDDYGKDEETGGTIIETRGGIVVYMDMAYYDEDRQVVDPYADDNLVIYSSEEDTDTAKINSELGIARDMDTDEEDEADEVN